MRRQTRRYSQMARFRRSSLSGIPVLLANSFPKSGTHLLTQVLIGFTRIGPAVDSGLPAIVTFHGDTGAARSEGDILSDLQRLLPGDITYGHLHAFPKIVDYACQESFAPFFIVRDPRDVAVSHVHYITTMAPDHIHHNYYKFSLTNFDERLSASINGFTPEDNPTALNVLNARLPDIQQRFEPYLGWLDREEVLVLHFEDFISDRNRILGSVYDHAVRRGFTANCDRGTAIEILGQGIVPENSPTFRSGKIGDWHGAFAEEHKRLFKDIAGDLLIKLGYEQDHNW